MIGWNQRSLIIKIFIEYLNGYVNPRNIVSGK